MLDFARRGTGDQDEEEVDTDALPRRRYFPDFFRFPSLRGLTGGALFYTAVDSDSSPLMLASGILVVRHGCSGATRPEGGSMTWVGERVRASTLAGYDVVRILLGVILLTAAALKGYQLATEPVREIGLLNSRWFLIGVVEFEPFFGLWLLAGLYPKSIGVQKDNAAWISAFSQQAGPPVGQPGHIGFLRGSSWLVALLCFACFASISLFTSVSQKARQESYCGNVAVHL